MKIRFYHFVLILIALVSTHAAQGQTADVTAGCTPLRVNFTPPTDATSFFWDFKDGGTSVLEDASNVFVEPGVYEVDFKTTQDGAVVGSITITVGAKPTLEIAANPMSGCSPLEVSLANATVFPDGVNILSERWVFHDGTEVSGSEVIRTYDAAGSFPIALEVKTSSATCDATQQFTDAVEVVAGPLVQFTTGPTPPASCTAPLTVSFANQTPAADNLSFSWDFGNGMTSTEVNPPAQTYSEDGDYTVTLSATDNAKGCTKTFSQVVSIGSPIAGFNFPATICAGTAVVLENTSSEGAYTWEIPGQGATTAGSPEITFTEKGDFEVRLIVSSPGGCSSEITQTVTVDKADPIFSMSPNYGCSEPMAVSFTPNTNAVDIQYAWAFGDDSTSTIAALVHDYNADNDSPYHENGVFNFTPSLTVTTASGCVDSSSQELILDIPLARFMPDTVSGCAPLTVEFSDSSRSSQNIISYQWIYDTGETNNFSTPDPHNYTFTEAGEYEVQLVITNNLGCVDSSYTVRVEVGTKITPSYSIDKTEVCVGEAVQFTDNTNSDLIDEWHYYTDNNRSSHCFNEANPAIPFETATGAFGVKMVVGYNGCLDSIVETNIITVKGPLAKINYSIPCADPTNVTFTNDSEESSTVSWDFGDGMTSTEASSTVHTYAKGDYQVILTAEDAGSGCPASTDTALVKVRNLTSIGMVEYAQCKNQPVSVDASMAIDVDTSCVRGYTWHFNHPGVRPLTIKEPTNDEISYPDTGFYTIELVVEDVNGCVDTSSYPVYVYEAIADFTMDKSTICFPMSVSFTNNSTTTADKIETYMWDFGDGVGMAETENANYTYGIDPGEDFVTVTLSIEDSEGCPGEKTMQIETYRPTSQITSDPAVANICAGESVNFSATDFTERGSSLNYSWDLGNGAGSAASTAFATYNEGGTYNVVLNFTERSTGCAGVATKTVNVQDYPIAAFATDADGVSPLCHPRNLAFSNVSETTSPVTSVWNFGNGTSGVGNQATSFFDKGSYTVALNTQTSYGCADRTERSFTLVGPTGNILLNGGPFCKGEDASVSAINLSEVSSYSWFFQGQERSPNEPNVSLTVEEVPTNGQAPITLNLVGPEGCTFAEQTTIAVNQVIADFTTTADPCNPSVVFSNQSIGSNTFNWDFGNGETTNSLSPVFEYANTGTFDVTLMVQNTTNGCVDAITKSITVGNPTPVIARALDTCIVTGTSFSLPIINNDVASLVFDQEFLLTCPDGGPVATCATPSLNTTTDASFTLVVQDPCFGSQSYDYNIGVFDPNGNLLPNAFTPDGDGTNDTFNVILSESGCSEVTAVLDFKIFDRWGTKVYDNDTPSQGWNGLYKGKRQNPDVYVYAIEVRLNDGSTANLSGDVTLIR